MQGWSILFFIFEEDNLTKKYASELIDTLKTIKPSDKMTILVFESIYDKKAGGKINGNLYELKHNDNALRDYVLRKPFGIVNPGNESVLKSVLKYIRDQQLLRDRFLLFTWDHGAGFGVFDGDPRVGSNRYTSYLAEKSYRFLEYFFGFGKSDNDRDENEQNQDHKSFKIVTNSRAKSAARNGLTSFQSTPYASFIGNARGTHLLSQTIQINMLTNAEINSALRVLNRKTDLVIMMNCWMQMLETGAELAENVNFFVGAETLHWFAGYDYALILNSMAERADISAEEVASITVNTVEANFMRQPEWKEKIKDVIISAVRLDKISDMKDLLNDVCADLLKSVDTSAKQMRAVRKDCIDFSGDSKFFIDCYDCLQSFCKVGFVSKEKVDNFWRGMDKYITDVYVGEHLKKIRPATGKPYGNGFSIFHPGKKMNFDRSVYFDEFYLSNPIQLAKTKWREYLVDYWKKGNQ